jgi:hypothetical protein
MIAKALESCSQFLVFVSPNSVNSQNVRNEINFALNRRKPFLAVHIQETALPTGLELRMGDIQAVLKYRTDLQRYQRQLEGALKDSVRMHDKRPPSQGPTDQSALLEPDIEHTSLQPKPVVVNECTSLLQAERLHDEAAQALATQIAINGTDTALKDVRFARFGGLDVVDPREVDGFLDLHRLIQEYQKQPQRVPLAFAVFSPPGEPKVFCAQQVADAIFAFLSGTTDRFKRFGQYHIEQSEIFWDAGGPLFLSCLKGYLDILGVNPYQAARDLNEDRGLNPTTAMSDKFCIIRRALWLRHCLRRRTPWLFYEALEVAVLNIDPSVLNAFLKIGRYNHGLRSMESVIGMSALTGKTYFSPECLPSSAQLNLHLNGQEFLTLVQEAKLSTHS